MGVAFTFLSFNELEGLRESQDPQSLRRNQAAASLWLILISLSLRHSAIRMSCILYVISIRTNRNRSEDNAGRSGRGFLEPSVSVSQHLNSGNFLTPRGSVSLELRVSPLRLLLLTRN